MKVNARLHGDTWQVEVTGSGKIWLAEIDGTHPKWRFLRRFVKGQSIEGGKRFEFERGSIVEVNAGSERQYFKAFREWVPVNREEAEEHAEWLDGNTSYTRLHAIRKP